MAVAFQTVSAVARATNTTTLNINKPLSVALGDLLVCYIATADNDTTGRTIDIRSGWTAASTMQENNDGSGSWRSRAQYKVADAGDVAASNYDFTVSATTDILAGAIYRIDGQSSSAPINASTVDGVANDQTPTFTAGTITPTEANCLLLFLCCHSAGSSTTKVTSSQAITTSNPSWTEDFDDHNSTSLTVAGAHATRPEVTATGDASFTSNGDAGTDCGLVLLAIAPENFIPQVIIF